MKFFDKITILDIKLARIQDNERLMYVRGERETLDMALINEGILIDSELYEELKDINTKIWDTEAGFREKRSKERI